MDTIGAHAIWNNNQALGISLIGDFQVEEPTPAMIASLKRLTTALALHYDIDPTESVVIHKTTKTEPYIADYKRHRVSGHRDV